MKVVNLDKYKTNVAIKLDGKEYVIRGITVDEFINEKFKMPEGMTDKDSFIAIIKMIAELTGAPEETLAKQELGVLMAIMDIINGKDIETESVPGN